jgi:hypothetical protein
MNEGPAVFHRASRMGIRVGEAIRMDIFCRVSEPGPENAMEK